MILLSDTDFLSSFLKIGQLEIVRDFYRTEHLFIASGVYRELSRTDLVTKVDDREWIRVRPVSEAELAGYREEGAFARLGRGEQETIALAGSLKATVLMSDQRALRFATLAQPSPVITEALLLPGEYGAGLDKRQGVLPARPQTRQPDPEETVGDMETRTRYGPLIDGHLVAEGNDFKLQCKTRAE